jgi:magnesium transporter
MQPPLAVFRPQTTIAEATEQIRRLARKAIITYGFVTDEQENLLGVVVMRDMLLAQSSQRLEEIMLTDPFHLTPEMSLPEAMGAGSALSSVSSLRKNGPTARPVAWPDAV